MPRIPSSGLNWQTVNFSLTGNGQSQTIRILTEATSTDIGGRGAMIDDIALTKVVPLNQGMEDGAIKLSSVAASLNDTDGSETLTLALGALPAGTVISDGQYIFTATSTDRVLDITQWNLANLSLKPPANFGGNLTLQVIATSIEVANGSRATAVRDLSISVTAQADAPVVTLTPRDLSLSRELVNTSWESALNLN